MTTKTTDLVYWITERYRMHACKDAAEVMGAGPGLKYGWSDDPIMGTTRWCNVHREDDKVTRWLAEYWRPTRHAVWEIVLARMINYIPALEELICAPENWGDLEIVKEVLKTRRGGGEKVFTSAYTVSTSGKSMDKIDYVVDWVVAEVKDAEDNQLRVPWLDSSSLAAAHATMTLIDGLGSFLAAQVVADLKNTAGHPLQAAPDWHTWAAPGPGSLRGLEAFYGRPSSPSKFTADIKACWEEVRPHLHAPLNTMHMQDFQNCLCEFSKYMKLKEGRGHARNRYRAGNA